MATQQKQPREFTGYHMLAVLVLFFGVIISVNLTMAWFANSSWTGLVVKNSYVASQSFNKDTAELQRQHSLGWTARPTHSRGVFMIELRDKDGNSIPHAAVSAKLGRPSHENEDMTLTLSAGPGAIYEAPAELSAGAWDATITAEAPSAAGEAAKWYGKYRFMVK